MSDYVYPCPCGNYGDSQKTMGVRLLSLRHTKSASPVPCWIALIFILRFHLMNGRHNNYEKPPVGERTEVSDS